MLDQLLLVSTAYAQTTGAAKNPSVFEAAVLPLLIIFVIFYFFIIRPQSKRAREQSNMLKLLKVGDEVITSSGIIGKVKSIAEQFVILEIGSNATMKIVKQYIVGLTRSSTGATATTNLSDVNK